MSTINDLLALSDGNETTSAEEEATRMQRIINDGVGWHMQGSIGRSMMAAIDAGEAMLGKKSARDYWGNYIPSRDEVEPGTKGSRAYVVAKHGEAWALMLDDADASGPAPEDDTQ